MSRGAGRVRLAGQGERAVCGEVSVGMKHWAHCSQREWVMASASGVMCFWLGFAEKADGTAVDIFSFGMCALEVRSRAAAEPGNLQGLLLDRFALVEPAGWPWELPERSPCLSPSLSVSWGSLAVMETSLMGAAKQPLLPWPSPGHSRELHLPLLCPAGAPRPPLTVSLQAVAAPERVIVEGSDGLCCSRDTCAALRSLSRQTVGLLVLSVLSTPLHSAQRAAPCICSVCGQPGVLGWREIGPKGRAAREPWEAPGDPDLVGRGVPGPEAGLAGPCALLRCSTAATLAGGVPWEALKDRARARLPAGTAALLLPQMAVLEIQTNGDTRVSEEAIVRARHSLDDPNMRVSAANLQPDPPVRLRHPSWGQLPPPRTPPLGWHLKDGSSLVLLCTPGDTGTQKGAQRQ